MPQVISSTVFGENRRWYGAVEFLCVIQRGAKTGIRRSSRLEYSLGGSPRVELLPPAKNAP